MLILYWLKKSLVIRKAIAIQKVCREMPNGLKDHELIVGIPTISSLGFGNVFLLGYVHTVFLDVGNQYMFPSVVASAIGGISLAGGAAEAMSGPLAVRWCIRSSSLFSLPSIWMSRCARPCSVLS